MTGPWQAVDTATGETFDAANPFKALHAAERAGVPTAQIRIRRNGDVPMPPPPQQYNPKTKVNYLWDTLEQAQRAWAVTQACRAAAGTDRHLTMILADADQLLAWVEHPPTGAEGAV